jgi:hypothetical protein
MGDTLIALIFNLGQQRIVAHRRLHSDPFNGTVRAIFLPKGFNILAVIRVYVVPMGYRPGWQSSTMPNAISIQMMAHYRNPGGFKFSEHR